jgi:hypothetical protein
VGVLIRHAALAALSVSVACGGPARDAVMLPDGPPGIGFDDLRWSPTLGRVVAPGGRAGKVYLVEPTTEVVSVISGFSATADYAGGHDDGPTSSDEGGGLLFVTDRTSRRLSVVDPASGAVVGGATLATSPDYVRYVATTGELWVSEPAGAQIEIFALDGTTPRAVAALAVPNGPESLVVDAARGRAYTHAWQAATFAIDVRSRAVVGHWPNGCAASRGIDLEPEHGWVLAACNEGTLTVLDPLHDGRVVASLASGAGYDVIGYARSTRHVYLAGGACGCLTVLGLSEAGGLDLLGRFDAPGDTHCVVADDRGHAWVCAPSEGALRRVDDPFPSWGVR